MRVLQEAAEVQRQRPMLLQQTYPAAIAVPTVFLKPMVMRTIATTTTRMLFSVPQSLTGHQ
jgi:hypothetical protein